MWGLEGHGVGGVVCLTPVVCAGPSVSQWPSAGIQPLGATSPSQGVSYPMEGWRRVGSFFSASVLSPYLLSPVISCCVLTIQLTQCDPSTQLPGCPTRQL